MKIITAIAMLSVVSLFSCYGQRTTVGKFPTDPRLGSIGTEPSYLTVNNKLGAFYAWTRGKYYFSASAKGGAADLDAFMQAFPY